MEIIDNLQKLKNLDSRSVVTIGNFDGIHAGHKELINETLTLANVNNVNPVVLTFDPLPEEFFERKNFGFNTVYFVILSEFLGNSYFCFNAEHSVTQMAELAF